jgi:hypothetical protein
MATNAQHLLNSLNEAVAYYEKIQAGWVRSALAKMPDGAKLPPYVTLGPIGTRAAVLRGGFTMRAGHRDKRAELVWLIMTLREIRLWVVEQLSAGTNSFEPTPDLAKVLGPTVYTGSWSRQFDTNPEPAYENRTFFGWEARLPDKPFETKTYLRPVRKPAVTTYIQTNYGGQNTQGLTVVKGMSQQEVLSLVAELREVMSDDQMRQAAVAVEAQTKEGRSVVDAVKDVFHGLGLGAEWFNKLAGAGINAVKVGLFLAALRTGAPLPPI